MNIPQRLTALERLLTPNETPSVIYTDGVETESQAIARYNRLHRTSHPLQAFNLIRIVFTERPPAED